MSASVARKVALITGGTKGIGKATALHLASKNFDVALNYASSVQDYTKTKAEIEALNLGTKVYGVQADLGTSEGVNSVVNDVVKEFGKIDVLVNNAAISVYKDFFHATEADLDLSYNLNYKAPFLLTQQAIPHMPKGSKIIFLSTSLTKNSSVGPLYVVYVPTKGSIIELAKILARTLGTSEYQINVNVVSPGPTATELFFKGKTPEVVKMIENFAPAQRLGQPEEIAEAIGFFATSASWVSGQNLFVNGAAMV